MKTVAEALKTLVKNTSVKMEVLSKTLGVSMSTLYRWRRGEVGGGIDQVLEAVNALGGTAVVRETPPMSTWICYTDRGETWLVQTASRERAEKLVELRCRGRVRSIHEWSMDGVERVDMVYG